MPYIAINDLQMYYEKHGVVGGPPMVLLHGFIATGQRTWSGFFEAFGARYELFIPDWRGHGRTDNPGGLDLMSHRQFAADIITFCGELGIERPVFFGTSSGAMMLLSLAVAAPSLPRALVLSASTYYFPEPVRQRWREQTPETAFSETRNEQLRAIHTAMGADHWRLVNAAFIGLASHSNEDDFPADDDLGSIAIPVLLLHGDRDWFFPVEIPTHLYRIFPNAELAILPNTGHSVPLERPAWVASVVMDFLERRLSEAPAPA